MGFSLSVATGIIGITLLITLEIFASSIVPTMTESKDSYNSSRDRATEELLSDITVTGIVDTVNTWWNVSFQYRKQITINSTQESALKLADFPVLLNITDTDLKNHVLQSNGNDIAFVDSQDKVKFNHQIEKYTPSTGHLIAWVNVTSIELSDFTIFYMYYGNATCENQQNIHGTWDGNYVMVQHLNETSGTHQDSTSYNNDGTITGGVTQGTTGLGQLDGSDLFHGGEEYINFNNASSLAPTQLTLEGWVRDPPWLNQNRPIGTNEHAISSSASISNNIVNTNDSNTALLEDNSSRLSPDEFPPIFNFSNFWVSFNTYARWSLEYKQNETWIYCNNSLYLNYRSIADNSKKFSLDFIAPYAGSYRLRLTIGLNLTNMNYTAQKNLFVLSYSRDSNFLLSFNYSDIASLPNLSFAHGVSSNKFWFLIDQKNCISEGSKISLDPQYIVSAFAATNSTAYNNGRKLVRTSNGNLHCVFHAIPFSESKYNIYYAKSTDEGVTWTKTRLTYDSSFHQLYPSIAVDGNDHLHVVWQGVSGTSRQTRIRYCTYTTSWSAPSNITDGNRAQYSPSIAVDKNNYLHIVWYGYHDGSTLSRQIRYTNYSGSGSVIYNLTSGAFNQSAPSIAIDSSNYLHIAWGGFPSGGAKASCIRYKKYTTSWSTTTNISAIDLEQNYPSIAIASNNNLHLVWHGKLTALGNYQIRYSKYITSWSAPENLTNVLAVDQTYPSISVDSRTYLHVVWQGPPSAAVNQQIRCKNYTTSWQAAGNLTTGGNHYYPSLIWSYYPTAINASRPETGFAFVFINGTTVTYYKTTDLSWKNKLILTMTRGTYSLEINSNGTTLYGYIGGIPVSTSIDTNWHYVVLTYSTSGAVYRLYKDGELKNSMLGLLGITYPSPRPNVTAGKFLTGWLDELRISKTPRTTEWINTSYLNQHAPSEFYFLSTEKSIDMQYLNITVNNTGEVTLLTEDFTVLVNGMLYEHTSSHIYLSPKGYVYFISDDLIAPGQKRIKVITDNGIEDYYYYPG